MERNDQEKQTSIDFRCRKVLPGEAKCASEPLEVIKNMESGMVDDCKNCISSPTPEKPDWKLTRKEIQLRDHSSQRVLFESPLTEVALKFAELPEKYNMVTGPFLLFVISISLLLPFYCRFKALADLFDRMGTSIRLLGLKRRLPIFKNICIQVELLTKRDFTYAHLAQMKYIFPDAIQLEKVLIHDEKSLCVVPDLKVNLIFDVLHSHLYAGQSRSKSLCEAFRLRLLEFFNVSPGNDTEIPEAVMPEPFNCRNHNEDVDSLSEESFNEIPQQEPVELDPVSSVSHFSSSFCKRFCHKVIVPEAEQTKIIASTSLSAIAHDGEGNTSKGLYTTPHSATLPAFQSISASVCTPIHDRVEKTPAKRASLSSEPLAGSTDSLSARVVPQPCESSPINLVKVAGDFMAETPALQTPKRPIHRVTEFLANTNEKSAHEPKTNPSARRTLVYSPVKVGLSKAKLDFDAVEGTTNIDVHCSFENQPSKRSSCGTETTVTCDATTSAKEGDKVDQPVSEKCKAVSDSLQVTFDTIHHISKSTDCSLITKQELVHKIISNNLDVEDTCEVEEQLGLLEELLPEWMSKKSTWNGDFVYCIKRLADATTVRARLSEGLCAAAVEKVR